MRIQDLYRPLTEGREAPLYHWVGDEKLLAILEQNKMEAYWEHMIPGQAKKYSYGNSMSRNPRFTYPEVGRKVRLILDQSKLAQTNKIIPLDGERTFHTGQGSGAADYTIDRDKPIAGETDRNVMAEEFVIGDIKPLNKYLLKIEYIGKSDRIRGIIQQYASKYGIPVG